jgi:hypothetical protein
MSSGKSAMEIFFSAGLTDPSLIECIPNHHSLFKHIRMHQLQAGLVPVTQAATFGPHDPIFAPLEQFHVL